MDSMDGWMDGWMDLNAFRPMHGRMAITKPMQDWVIQLQKAIRRMLDIPAMD